MKKTVFVVVKKLRDWSASLTSDGSCHVIAATTDLIRWLLEQQVGVVVEEWLYKRLQFDEESHSFITSFDVGSHRSGLQIDFVVCIGGDGTLLHANYLFQDGAIPVILPFHAGTVGFLMTLAVNDIQPRIEAALRGDYQTTSRSRLVCTILSKKADKQEGLVSSLASKFVKMNSYQSFDDQQQMEIQRWCGDKTPKEAGSYSYTILNECVISRGQSPVKVELDIFANRQFLTTVQADGVLIATPTGSTAYNMSVGGSMVHPLSRVILVTPICPNSLSCRPIILPDEVEVGVKMSKQLHQNEGHVIFDGRNRLHFNFDDELRVVKSAHPLATVNAEFGQLANANISEWAHSLSHCLHWNSARRK